MNLIRDLEDPEIITDYENVYSPSDDTYLFLDYFREHISNDKFDGIDINDLKNILDLGTGTGIIAIYLQLMGDVLDNFNPKIYASDILTESIDCAKKNQKLNKIDNKIEFIHSDLFNSFPETLKHSFDIITFNPPYLPSSKLITEDQTKTAIDHSWDGGKEGNETLLKFIDKAKDFLNPKTTSYIYFISSSRTNLKNLKKNVKQKGYSIKILKKLRWFFEDINLNRIQLV